MKTLAAKFYSSDLWYILNYVSIIGKMIGSAQKMIFKFINKIIISVIVHFFQ